MRYISHVLLATTLALAACAGTETGNGQQDKDRTAKVELKLIDSDGLPDATAFVGDDADGVSLTVTEAWANVDGIDLWLADGVRCSDVYDANATPILANPDQAPRCSDDDDKLRIDGPFWVDLVTGVSEPPLDMVYLPPGAYDRADVKLHPRGPAQPHGDGVVDATLAARGSVVLDGEDTRFLLTLRFTSVVRFDGDVDAANGLDAVLLLLDVHDWFADLPFADCAARGDLGVADDGTLLLHDGKGGCNDAERAITEAIRASGRLAARP